jgi:hypothetical protein
MRNQLEWNEKRRDQAALNMIHRLMDGKEWSLDTLDEIANLILTTGRKIREPMEVPDDEEN